MCVFKISDVQTLFSIVAIYISLFFTFYLLYYLDAIQTIVFVRLSIFLNICLSEYLSLYTYILFLNYLSKNLSTHNIFFSLSTNLTIVLTRYFSFFQSSFYISLLLSISHFLYFLLSIYI